MTGSAVTEEDGRHSGPDGSLDHVADHVSEARRRAREVLSCEPHLGDVDDWRQATVTARDGVVLLWLIWVAMRGFGAAEAAGPVLVSAGLGISVYLGVASAVATRIRLRYLESELDRERREIRDHPESEREEVRALYAAKGFDDPLLTQNTDELCADDDRLMKVMMEEELGLFIQEVNHPLLVCLWNTAGAVIGTLLLAVPVCFQQQATANIWMPVGTVIILVWIAVVTARLTGRSLIPMLAIWLSTAGFAAGLTHFLAELWSGRN